LLKLWHRQTDGQTFPIFIYRYFDASTVLDTGHICETANVLYSTKIPYNFASKHVVCPQWQQSAEVRELNNCKMR